MRINFHRRMAYNDLELNAPLTTSGRNLIDKKPVMKITNRNTDSKAKYKYTEEDDNIKMLSGLQKPKRAYISKSKVRPI